MLPVATHARSPRWPVLYTAVLPKCPRLETEQTSPSRTISLNSRTGRWSRLTRQAGAHMRFVGALLSELSRQL
jgi:hypothetical protein